MQIVHDTSASKKKPMQVVEEGREEKLKKFDDEEALEKLEAIEEPTEATDADEDEPQEAKVEEEKEEVEAKADEEEEEAPKKKSRLQRRIDELVKKSSAYEQERNQYYGRVQQLETELKKTNTLNKDYTKLQKNYYDSQLESAKKLLEKARSEHTSAYESGDSGKMLEAAESIADAKVDLKSLEQQKHLFEDTEPVAEPSYPSVQPAQTQAPQQAVQPDPRALQWAQSNTWFGDDAPRTGAAYAIDAQLKMEGYNPSSEDYYSELDKRIGDAFPSMKTNSKPKQVVASVTRAPSAPKRVKLTQGQLAMAKKLGVPQNEYAKFVRNTNDQ